MPNRIIDIGTRSNQPDPSQTKGVSVDGADQTVSVSPFPAPHPTGGSKREMQDDELSGAARDFAPWAIALLLHACLVAGAILTVWVSLPVADVERIIPMGGLQNHPVALTFRSTKTHGETRPTTGGFVTKEPDDVKKLLAESVIVAPDLIGANGGSAAALFGQSSTTGGGPIGLWEDGAPPTHAKTFAYVVDASGSMLDTMPFVVLELKRSINSLNENHSFTVVFYQGERVMEAGRPGLKKATSQNKQEVFAWMDKNVSGPQGLSNPIKAIRTALKYQPELMYLLSDNITGGGIYTVDQEELRTTIKQANVGKTKVNTIQFIYPDPLILVPGMKGSLELISRDSGGLYRFVSARELGIR